MHTKTYAYENIGYRRCDFPRYSAEPLRTPILLQKISLSEGIDYRKPCLLQVVYILEKKHSRAATGFIKLLADKNSELFKKCAMFSPVDHRVPRAYVSLADCPSDFVARPEDYSNMLFICRIVDWKEDSNFASGYVAAIENRDK